MLVVQQQESARQMENMLILCYENTVLQTLDSNTKMKKITSQWQHQEQWDGQNTWPAMKVKN